MEELIELFRKKLASTDTLFIRSDELKINWDARLLCIRGARGVGKTTLILQHIKKAFEGNYSKALYVSLDNLYFAEHSLLSFAKEFIKRGGTHLFLDEVHKYPEWSRTVKNLYDDCPELNVVITGSSLLEILNARADLSRRALVYDMQGLSFREYLSLKEKINLPSYTLDEILFHNEELSAEIVGKIKPFEFFGDYLKYGYYPFFTEGIDDYNSRLNETLNMILEVELPFLRGLEPVYVPKIKKLLAVIGRSAPFIPNVTELASHVEVARQTLLSYFNYLEESKIINLLFKETRGMGALEKPDKILLENTNLMHLFGSQNIDVGSMRETFVLNQLRKSHAVLYSADSDFYVDGKYTFEVGGKNKKRRQIKNVSDSFIIADDIEYGTDRRIPIWLLGFMY